MRGHAVALLLEALPYRSKVAGSTLHGVSGNFHRHNPSGCTMVLESTQPLIERTTRNIYWKVKAVGA
jgi:hypothetical protein